ncbi:D-amino acid dehydrogenase small subunit [Hartmannibacter diazotrophicus]|uniref:D-amino acid dehydrogenase small subunit n=1 Tax=Hartmannibacter diazotrophicus TaxID=1482074 RepID=A0A2C9DD97_9HYPH|nr:FAD-binding oxidoreductase [Hartmannibacter diazotrophicus]SON58226.1 D-amino acid dehydrogenase small subunit [Hartmannibacter diazotrophicus]
MAQAIVLGAGMVGISAALHLQQRGFDVTLVDRREPGEETSYGNAGIIQTEAVEPYAMPQDLATLFAIALQRSNDVHFHWRAFPSYARPLLAYWWNSTGSVYQRIARTYSGLIVRASEEHQPFIEASGSDGLIRRTGYRSLYRTASRLAKAKAAAQRIKDTYGVDSDVIEPEALTAAEPALKTGGAGAIHWKPSWSVRDPGALAAAYARLFVERGGNIIRADAMGLAQTPAGGWRLPVGDGTIEAEHAVIALGPWSPHLALKFGYKVPMFLKRGYHQHYLLEPQLQMPLHDPERGYFMAPMVRGLRITTGAELAEQSASQTPVQLMKAETAAKELLPLGAKVENMPWLGARPCMPDMLPVVGPSSRHKGLWFDFGHGHQGLTLGPATGRLLAEMMTGEAPIVDPTPFSPARFR